MSLQWFLCLQPIASNTPGYKDWVSKFNDGDEMTLGHTGGHKQDDTQPQRQSFEIDLGSMQEIHSVVIVDRGGYAGRLDKLKVMLLDDDLQMVTKTSNLTVEQAQKGTKHKYNFATKKWTIEPVDCVGKWGEWSACSTGCVEEGKNNEGQKKRDWITLRKAENGGKACVYDVNKDGFKVCKGSIGKWSGCKKTDPYDCKGKMSFIVTDKGEDEGKTCPKPKDCKADGFCLRHDISNRRYALNSVKNGSWVADDGISEWDQTFCKVDQPTLFELILAANYLDIKPLLDLCCKTVAMMIKGKTPEEIRQT